MKIESRLALCILILLVSGPLRAQQAVFPEQFTVAQDGSGNYKTIQEAINAVRDLSQVQVKIFIRKGVYHEKLVVPSWKTKISLIGEDRQNTIISGQDYSGKNFPGTDWNGRDKFITFTSYTVLVVGNDFHAESLTIENTAGRVGQAVALHVEGDRCTFINVSLLGNQDTLYTATDNSRQYYKDCLIEGTTDFIFGEATCVFENCVIRSKASSYITAASTPAKKKYGYVFINCKLTADSSVRVYLGRPWRPYAKTVFLNTEMGGHIVPEGWDNWKNPQNETTAFYAEYGSYGPGGNTGERVSWSHQLKKKQVRQYSLKNIFADWDVGQ